MDAISLIVPVYNESQGVESLVRRLEKVLLRLPEGSEALLVNDGSTDGSGDALAGQLDGTTPRSIRLIEHPRNRGYGAALKTGINEAANDLIAISDADGTYPLEALPKLLVPIQDGAAMVVGARSLRHQPPVRRPAKWFLNALASWLAGERIPDLNSGLRIFRREHARRHWRMLPDGFSFTTTMTMNLIGDGLRVDFLPIRYRERVGFSKIRPIRDMGAFLLLIARMSMAYNPLKIFGPLGLSLIGLGVALLIARAFMINPFGVATTVTLLVGGVQLLAAGLLADLVNRRGAA